MCTRPISVRKTIAGRCVERVVPCGKCEECREKQRSEVALLTLLESEFHDSFEYYTLTYRQDSLPLAETTIIDCDRTIVGYDRGRSFKRVDEFKDMCKPIEYSAGGEDFAICPTLYRQDWKEHMHRFRSACRRKGLSMDFSFIQFGEYGERRKRPHFHAIFFGFTPEHTAIFDELWERYFGNVKRFHVNRYNDDGSNAFVKVSKYVSKYVSKGDYLPQHVLDGYCEKPRRLSSIRYGRKHLDLEKLRNFTLQTI